MNEWTVAETTAYVNRIAGISDRFRNWAVGVETHRLWPNLTIEQREEFHDRILIAMARGQFAYIVPRLS